MNELEAYYNKFNEEKRLNSRHGQVEFFVTMHYLNQYLQGIESRVDSRAAIKILDVGAGTGRYAIPLSEAGYDVTAVEPVHHNLGIMRMNAPKLKAFEGKAQRLRRFADNSFDVVLLFGPMYHLKDEKDRQQTMLEAKRVLKPGGLLFISYIMNEYSVLLYGFRDRHILEAMKGGQVDEAFKCTELANPLYHYVRLEDIYAQSEAAGFERVKILSQDGPANHMRRELNAMDEDEFEVFKQYQLAVCERSELLGAGCHTLDVLRK